METGENRAAGPKAKRAVAEGYDAIVVCGGDGTIFDVIQGIAGSDVPLGIIPFGTGNVMAQNLKLPKNPVAAARWILRSRPVPPPWEKSPAAPRKAGKAGYLRWQRVWACMRSYVGGAAFG